MTTEAGWTLDQFAGLVGRMRAAQARYFRMRARVSSWDRSELVAEAIALEAEVDAALAAIADRRPLFDRE